MLLATRQPDQHNLTNAPTEFKMAMNSHSFDVILRRLYADPLLAVLRELSCNANDAHIEHGVDQPFEVKLPTVNRSSIIVRDYAKGLTYDEVTNLYTTMFASTKSNSAAYTGGFGLGSKAPFALVDSFQIESIVDEPSKQTQYGYTASTRTRYVYVASLDDGIPKLHLIGSEQTTEPTGMTIEVPLNYAQKNKLTTALIQRALDPFEDRVLVNGDPGAKIRWKNLRPGVQYAYADGYGSQAWVQIANVRYAVQGRSVPRPMIIKYDAPSFTPQASRETISEAERIICENISIASDVAHAMGKHERLRKLIFTTWKRRAPRPYEIDAANKRRAFPSAFDGLERIKDVEFYVHVRGEVFPQSRLEGFIHPNRKNFSRFSLGDIDARLPYRVRDSGKVTIVVNDQKQKDRAHEWLEQVGAEVIKIDPKTVNRSAPTKATARWFNPETGKWNNWKKPIPEDAILIPAELTQVKFKSAPDWIYDIAKFDKPIFHVQGEESEIVEPPMTEHEWNELIDFTVRSRNHGVRAVLQRGAGVRLLTSKEINGLHFVQERISTPSYTKAILKALDLDTYYKKELKP